jgi:hypothetical protein
MNGVTRARGAVPLALVLGLAAIACLPSVRPHAHVQWSLLGGALLLASWTTILFITARHAGRALTIEIALRKQHYVQACAQAAVLLYWGWYWRPVYEAAPLIAAQLLAAYAFDLLLGWSRRDRYILGFGPVPVVFSINLFLWFRPEWFVFQLLMVALGFAAKEFIRWERDGRQVHIFNPSSFTLAVFSAALLLTGRSHLTWGPEIASTQFYPPHIYLVLFLVGLPGQWFFGVTAMTMSAIVTTYLFGLAYFAVTGVYFFYDAYIPVAVFLGMHLLFTDPSTSPRTELGRLIFGALYGLSTIGLYQLLGQMGLPTLYDKLLQVPILNLAVKGIDRLAVSWASHRLSPVALGRTRSPSWRRAAYMSIWTLVFAGMSAASGVGDTHSGQWLPFWQEACGRERPSACRYLGDLLDGYCDQRSGWACNERAVLYAGRDGSPLAAMEALRRGCERGFAPACTNITRSALGAAPASAPPTLDDYPVILRGSKGPIADQTPQALRARACRTGWSAACGRDREAAVK